MTSASASSSSSSASPMYLKTKKIVFNGKEILTVRQHRNGPCPLIAICNFLLLKGEISFESEEVDQVSTDDLLSLLNEHLISLYEHLSGLEDKRKEDFKKLQNLTDALDLLPDLAKDLVTGINVDIKFTSIRDIETKKGRQLFPLLDIPLYHGWIVDPHDVHTRDAIGSKSYDDLQIELATSDLPVIQDFLKSNASQLTEYGLCSLQVDLNESELCVFFRNNHFNTMFKFNGELYILVTYLDEPSMAWEKLNEVKGNGVFVDSSFKQVNPENLATRSWDQQNAMSDTADYISKEDYADTRFNLDVQFGIELQQLEFEQQQQQQHQEPHRVVPQSPTTSRSGLVVCPKVQFKVPSAAAKEVQSSNLHQQLQKKMNDKDHIRNICVIGHVDHGKSTLANSLMIAAGVIAPDVEGDVPTTKLSSSYLSYKECLINLVDSPGHADFAYEVAAAVRITDGALVVVDCIEGVCVQTEAVIRQALCEQKRFVLTVNKLDRCFLELQDDTDKYFTQKDFTDEAAYQMLKRVVDDTNIILATYKNDHHGDVMVSPEKGTVAFSSGQDGWAFTLHEFARIWAPSLKLHESETMELLWGDHFFDKKTQNWTEEDTGAASCVRGFIRFVYTPLKSIIRALRRNDTVKLLPMLKKFNVKLETQEIELTGKDLMKCVMNKFLPASAVLEMCMIHLPSPHEAQRYRINLYEGPEDDDYAQGIRNCNSGGPLMLYVSKMTYDKAEMVAYGRVFSGTIENGATLRIMGPNDVPGMMTVQRAEVRMGNEIVTMESVPCGNTVAVFGLGGQILGNATLTTVDRLNASHPFRAIELSPPFVVVEVICQDSAKVCLGLKRLVKSDRSLVCTSNEDETRFFLAGQGERHIESCQEDLKGFVGGAKFKFSEPFVTFKKEKNGEKCEISEPYYFVEVLVPYKLLGGVYSVFNDSHGRVFYEARASGHPYYRVRAYMPVRTSFGVSKLLKDKTHGFAKTQCLLNDWDIIKSYPYSKSSELGKKYHEIRKKLKALL